MAKKSTGFRVRVKIQLGLSSGIQGLVSGGIAPQPDEDANFGEILKGRVNSVKTGEVKISDETVEGLTMGFKQL